MGYAVLNTLAYTSLVVAGAILPDKFLVSFEFMLLFTAPCYVFILLINTLQYFRSKNDLILKLIGSWLLLFGTLAVYFFYLVQGYTEQLWEHEIWFSANDVLHVGMIGWIAYIYLVLGNSIKDKTVN